MSPSDETLWSLWTRGPIDETGWDEDNAGLVAKADFLQALLAQKRICSEDKR